MTDKKIIFRLPSEIAHQFKVECAKLGISQNKVLMEFIKEFLKKYQEQK